MNQKTYSLRQGATGENGFGGKQKVYYDQGGIFNGQLPNQLSMMSSVNSSRLESTKDHSKILVEWFQFEQQLFHKIINMRQHKIAIMERLSEEITIRDQLVAGKNVDAPDSKSETDPLHSSQPGIRSPRTNTITQISTHIFDTNPIEENPYEASTPYHSSHSKINTNDPYKLELIKEILSLQSISEQQRFQLERQNIELQQATSKRMLTFLPSEIQAERHTQSLKDKIQQLQRKKAQLLSQRGSGAYSQYQMQDPYRQVDTTLRDIMQENIRLHHETHNMLGRDHPDRIKLNQLRAAKDRNQAEKRVFTAQADDFQRKLAKATEQNKRLKAGR